MLCEIRSIAGISHFGLHFKLNDVLSCSQQVRARQIEGASPHLENTTEGGLKTALMRKLCALMWPFIPESAVHNFRSLGSAVRAVRPTASARNYYPSRNRKNESETATENRSFARVTLHSFFIRVGPRSRISCPTNNLRIISASTSWLEDLK